jgi:hypothetical protein
MKYPGKILNEHPEHDPQLEWFQTASKAARHVNPCVRTYGLGPDGELCKNCRLFMRHNLRYFKCLLRGCTNGPGTDHRANWPACKRFVKDL